MPNSFAGPNEVSTPHTRNSNKLFHYGALSQNNLAVGIENVFHYNFMKISYYSTSATTLTISFSPAYLFSRKSGGVFQSPISNLKTETFTIPANTYKFFTLPIMGEYVSAKINAPDISNEEYTYLKVCYVDYQTITLKD